MGSDGESDQASGTSSDEVQSPTGVCLRNRVHRRISMEVRRALTPPRMHALEITVKTAYAASPRFASPRLLWLFFSSAGSDLGGGWGWGGVGTDCLSANGF